MPDAEKRLADSISNIKKVVFGKSHFSDTYLKLENSFFEIISSLAAIGVSIDDKRVVEALGDIIKQKLI